MSDLTKGPKQDSIPGKKENKPGQSFGISYKDNGLKPDFNTNKNTFKKGK